MIKFSIFIMEVIDNNDNNSNENGVNLTPMGNTLTNNDNNNAIASSRRFTKCIYRSPRRTFVLMWVFLIGMSIISLLSKRNFFFFSRALGESFGDSTCCEDFDNSNKRVLSFFSSFFFFFSPFSLLIQSQRFLYTQLHQ